MQVGGRGERRGRRERGWGGERKGRGGEEKKGKGSGWEKKAGRRGGRGERGGEGVGEEGEEGGEGKPSTHLFLTDAPPLFQLMEDHGEGGERTSSAAIPSRFGFRTSQPSEDLSFAHNILYSSLHSGAQVGQQQQPGEATHPSRERSTSSGRGWLHATIGAPGTFTAAGLARSTVSPGAPHPPMERVSDMDVLSSMLSLHVERRAQRSLLTGRKFGSKKERYVCVGGMGGCGRQQVCISCEPHYSGRTLAVSRRRSCVMFQEALEMALKMLPGMEYKTSPPPLPSPPRNAPTSGSQQAALSEDAGGPNSAGPLGRRLSSSLLVSPGAAPPNSAMALGRVFSVPRAMSGLGASFTAGTVPPSSSGLGTSSFTAGTVPPSPSDLGASTNTAVGTAPP